jgi:hypothetical protein
VSTLERHCRLLLRAYPAAYREVRGEEIIGTLMEATSPGRSWPRLRDIRGLIFGGLRARAAFNKRNTTGANLRLAALVGVIAYLAFTADTILGVLLTAAEHDALDAGPFMPFGWPMVVVMLLIAVTLVLAWVSRRRVIVLAAALPTAGAIALAGPWSPSAFGVPVTELAALAALIALVGARRPDSRWLWLIGLIAVVRLLPGLGTYSLAAVLLLALVVVSLAWLIIDARPAIALVVFALGFWVPVVVDDLSTGLGISAALPLLVLGVPISTAAIWLLRRQSARPGQPTRA